MGYKELYSASGTGDTDYRFKGSADRVFRVWDVLPAVVLTTPEVVLDENGIPLPGLNTPHPNSNMAGYRLDRYAVGSIEPPSFIVSALYSNDRRFAAPLVNDPTEPEYSAVEGGTVWHEHEIPFAVREARVTIAPNLTRQPAQPFIDRSQLTRAKGSRVGRSIVFNGWGFDQINLIEAQSNKIHVFGNRPWLFEGGNYQRAGPTEYTVDYQWTSDAGIKDRLFPVLNPNDPRYIAQPTLLFRMPLVQFPQLYLRPPFMKLIMFRESTDPAAHPTFEVGSEYDFSDPEGWRTLPGLS